MGVIIKNGIAVLESGEEKLDILVENGKIIELAPALSCEGHEVYNAEGCYIFPGFIDAHTHLDMDTGTALTADDFESGTLAALCGGTTSIIDFATQENGGTLAAALDAWHNKASGKASCNYGFHMAITHVSSDILNEIDDMFVCGVSSFKVYMAYDALRIKDAEIYEVLMRVKRGGGIVGAHCENGDLVNKLTEHLILNGNTAPCFHPLSRPAYLESEAITRFCTIGKAANSPVHIVHVTGAQALKSIAQARSDGGTVYAESCPQYFTLYEDKYRQNGFEGAKYVCSPPLRTKNDGEAIWKALLNGDISTVSTDHCSFNYKCQKEQGIGDFSKIPNGLPGIEHRGALVLSRFVAEGLPMYKAARALSLNAARLFGLSEYKGSIKKGHDADITIFSPHEHNIITAEKSHQNVDYTPYEGMELCGKIKAVFLNGILCAENGEPVIKKTGRYLHRGLSRAPL